MSRTFRLSLMRGSRLRVRPCRSSPRPCPIIGGVVLWLVTGSMVALLLAGLGPLIALAGFVDGRRSVRRERRRARAAAAGREGPRHARGRREARCRAASPMGEASRCRDAAHRRRPSVAQRPWSDRRARGGGRAGAERTSARRRDGRPGCRDRCAPAPHALERAPVLVPMQAGIAIRGRGAVAEAVHRALLLQLCLTLPPGELRLIGPLPESLAWGEQLPHRHATSGLAVAVTPVPGADIVIAAVPPDEPAPPACGAVIDVRALDDATLDHRGAVSTARPRRRRARPSGCGGRGARRTRGAVAGVHARRRGDRRLRLAHPVGACARARHASRRRGVERRSARRRRPRARRAARRRGGGHRRGQERAAHHLDPRARRLALDERGELPARRFQGRHGLRRAARAPARHGRPHRPRRCRCAAGYREPARRGALARGRARAQRRPRHPRSPRDAPEARHRRRRVRRAPGRPSRASGGLRRCRCARARARHAPRAGHAARRGRRARQPARELSAEDEPARDRRRRQPVGHRHRRCGAPPRNRRRKRARPRAPSGRCRSAARPDRTLDGGRCHLHPRARPGTRTPPALAAAAAGVPPSC